MNRTFFNLFFTLSGNVLDSGTVGEYKIFFTQNATDLADVSSIDGFLDILNSTDVINSDQLNPAVAGTKVELKIIVDRFDVGQQYFFRLVTISVDKTKKTWSNIASVYTYEGETVVSSASSLSGFLFVVVTILCITV